MSLGGLLFNMTMFADSNKRKMDRLNPYGPKVKLFSEGNQITDRKKRLSKIYEEQQKTKTAGLFSNVFKTDAKQMLAATGLLSLGGALLGIATHGGAGAIESVSRKISKDNAYKKYLQESGVKDTPEERKLFNAVFMTNPKYMTNPIMSTAIMRQVKNYGGLDINMISNLSRIPEGDSGPSLKEIATKHVLTSFQPKGVVGTKPLINPMGGDNI
ncbi:MAG: hypothetical protein J7L96_08000 [Bacteroidales bacterium]|nr:hypothetical protein [Bacteroidales bacterium]